MKNWLSPTVEENVYTVLFNFLPLVDFFKMFSSWILGPISLNHEEENRAKISWNCLFKLEKTLKNYRTLFWLRNVIDSGDFAHANISAKSKLLSKNTSAYMNSEPRCVRIMRRKGSRKNILWHCPFKLSKSQQPMSRVRP